MSVTVELTLGEHTMPIPKGMSELLENVFELAQFTGVWKVRLGQNVKATHHTKGVKVLRPCHDRGSVELVAQPGDNKTRHHCFVLPNGHGLGIENVYNRLKRAVKKFSKQGSANWRREEVQEEMETNTLPGKSDAFVPSAVTANSPASSTQLTQPASMETQLETVGFAFTPAVIVSEDEQKARREQEQHSKVLLMKYLKLEENRIHVLKEIHEYMGEADSISAEECSILLLDILKGLLGVQKLPESHAYIAGANRRRLMDKYKVLELAQGRKGRTERLKLSRKGRELLGLQDLPTSPAEALQAEAVEAETVQTPPPQATAAQALITEPVIQTGNVGNVLDRIRFLKSKVAARRLAKTKLEEISRERTSIEARLGELALEEATHKAYLESGSDAEALAAEEELRQIAEALGR